MNEHSAERVGEYLGNKPDFRKMRKVLFTIRTDCMNVLKLGNHDSEYHMAERIIQHMEYALSNTHPTSKGDE